MLGVLGRLISSLNFITSSRDNGGAGGGMTSPPGLRGGRIIVNEVTFLKGYVLLTAGWTEALVILTEKRKAKKKAAGRMQSWET